MNIGSCQSGRKTDPQVPVLVHDGQGHMDCKHSQEGLVHELGKEKKKQKPLPSCPLKFLCCYQPGRESLPRSVVHCWSWSPTVLLSVLTPEISLHRLTGHDKAGTCSDVWGPGASDRRRRRWLSLTWEAMKLSGVRGWWIVSCYHAPVHVVHCLIQLYKSNARTWKIPVFLRSLDHYLDHSL